MTRFKQRPSIRNLGLIIAAGCLSAAVGVQAKPQNDRFPIDLAEAQQRASERFASADENNDKYLDLAEFEAYEPQRGEGHPGPRHGKKGVHGRRGPGGERRGMKGPRSEQMRTAVRAEVFAILDSNGNGSIDQTEFDAQDQREVRRTAFKRARFKMLDVSGDNRLSLDEASVRLAHLRAADADGDGKIDHAEMRNAMRARQQAQTEQG